MSDEGYATITLPPLFPNEIRVRDVVVTLFADGTWRGDPAALETALTTLTRAEMGLTGAISWLVINAMRAAPDMRRPD